MTNEMPGVIWADESGKQGFSFREWNRTDKNGGTQYHHTAALIERIEGMKPYIGCDCRDCKIQRALLQDVIDILKGVE